MQKSTDLMVDPYKVNIWGTYHQLTMADVASCIRDSWIQELPLDNGCDHRSTWIHAGRVAFFVTNPDWEPIDVDVHFTGEGDPYLWVTDGNHRLAAALFLGQAYIDVRE